MISRFLGHRVESGARDANNFAQNNSFTKYTISAKRELVYLSFFPSNIVCSLCSMSQGTINMNGAWHGIENRSVPERAAERTKLSSVADMGDRSMMKPVMYLFPCRQATECLEGTYPNK